MTFLESFVLINPLIAYLILFGGMFIEGEIFFLTASIFALEGYLNLWWVAGVAFAGVIIGDVAWYYLGRYSKETRIGNWVSRKFEKHQGWLLENIQNHYVRLAFFSKFLYYVNRITPLLAGWQKMDFKKFLRVHIIAAAGWLGFMLALGTFFGLIISAVGLKVVLHRLYWVFLILAIVVIGGEYLLRKIFVKKIRRK